MYTVLFLLALTYGANCLSCTAQWQCSSVTTDYNYVTCTNGQCQCLAVNGFDGNATTSYPCQCTYPDSVYWLNGLPYCINYTNAANCENQQAQNAYQIAVVQAVFQAAIYPNVVTVVQNLIAGIPDATFNLFSNTSVGRWDPFGVFNDQVSLVESFYGLLWKPSDTVSQVIFKKLISQNNIVYINLDFVINATDDGITYHQFNLTHSGSFTFNNDGLIQSVDLIGHNQGAILNANEPAYASSSIQSICGLILFAAHCNATYDPTGYYTSFADCTNYLTNVYQWGTWDDLYFLGNSTICRFYYGFLAIGRPAVHCPHAGKTGGGVCINHDYNSYYLTDY
jgi:hypothetical protein